MTRGSTSEEEEEEEEEEEQYDDEEGGQAASATVSIPLGDAVRSALAEALGGTLEAFSAQLRAAAAEGGEVADELETDDEFSDDDDFTDDDDEEEDQDAEEDQDEDGQPEYDLSKGKKGMSNSKRKIKVRKELPAGSPSGSTVETCTAIYDSDNESIRIIGEICFSEDIDEGVSIQSAVFDIDGDMIGQESTYLQATADTVVSFQATIWELVSEPQFVKVYLVRQ